MADQTNGCGAHERCPDLPLCVLCPQSPTYWGNQPGVAERRAVSDDLGYRAEPGPWPRTCEQEDR